MAKRFTDSEKWNDAWFSDLPSKYKLFYLYLLDSCDHAGIWKVNFKIASFMIGEPLEPSEVKRVLQGRVRFLNDEYWFVEKFIAFQYNGIRSDKVGDSVSKILIQHDLQDVIDKYSKCKIEGANKGLGRGYEGTKDKDKAKAKDKVKVKDKERGDENLVLTYHEQMAEYARKYGAMDGLTSNEIEAYITKRGSDDWEKPHGSTLKRITQTNIRHDMLHHKRNGWLKREAQTETTYDAGAMN
jgi:hypothetical protein